MKLPNGGRAVVDLRKLTDYCLSSQHPRGRNKARVFAAALGLTVDDAPEVRQALLNAATANEASPAGYDEHGQRYVLDFVMVGPTGSATVRSTWMVRTGEDFPRFITCYVV